MERHAIDLHLDRPGLLAVEVGVYHCGHCSRWVVSSFSGVLCVDEVYQDQLALLLAVDPRSPQGDRLVGDQLVHGTAVEQSDVEGFLERLRRSGIDPSEVVTDGAALYPAVVAKVWPKAAHQLCLFHETRNVVRDALRAVEYVRSLEPTAPATPAKTGRLRHRLDATAPTIADRDARIALVQRLHRDGMGLRPIARQTGHGFNTVRAWIRNNVLPGGNTSAILTPTRSL